MQTNFTAKQLKDPRTAEIDKILRKCVHCGFCTATCPTYVLLGDERDSPRGRIYLMKEMFERGRKATPEVRQHVDRCLSCLSCMTTCPSGVDYMHLVDHARAHIEATGTRSFKDRAIRRLLASTLPHPSRFRLALVAARLARPFTGLLRRIAPKELMAMLDLAPKGLLRGASYSGPGTAATTGERRKRVILLAGCAQQVLRPEINDATIRLLARRGVDVEVAPNAGCCGALVHHLGREPAAVAMAKRNVDAWSRLMERGDPIDAVVINASGCGTTVKDYGHMLKYEPAYAERAAEISGMTRDITEFLANSTWGRPSGGRRCAWRITPPARCSTASSVVDEPKKLLRDAGFVVEGRARGASVLRLGRHLQHAAARPARDLRDRKVANIEARAPTWSRPATSVASAACRRHRHPHRPQRRTARLGLWRPVPRGLEALAKHVHDVPEAQPVLALT